MSDFNGMNGHIIRNTTRGGVLLGKVRGEPYGYAARTLLAVTVDFRVERLARQEQYETVTHETVTAPLDFAISGSVWNTTRSDSVRGGQIADVLGEFVTYVDGWNAESVARLGELWERWHLNSMRAACAHMDPATLVREDNGYGGTRIACGSVNTCPVNGTYTYGAAWLVEPLPEGFLAELDDLFSVQVDRKLIYRHPETVSA